ncbi:hypothetical protein AB0H17_18180 [Streptomyces olivoreticuli]
MTALKSSEWTMENPLAARTSGAMVPKLGTSDFLRSGNIIHAPSLDAAPGERVLDALHLQGASALITSRRPDEPVLRRWSRSAPGPKFLSYAVGTPHAYPFDGTGCAEFRQGGAGLEAIATALARCERHFAFARRAAGGSAPAGGRYARPLPPRALRRLHGRRATRGRPCAAVPGLPRLTTGMARTKTWR